MGMFDKFLEMKPVVVQVGDAVFSIVSDMGFDDVGRDDIQVRFVGDRLLVRFNVAPVIKRRLLTDNNKRMIIEAIEESLGYRIDSLV